VTACASLVGSFAAGVRVHEAGARADIARLTPGLLIATIALRPRVAARSPTSGASWPARKADACHAHVPPPDMPSHVAR
jgi:hypothetical protein